MTVVPTIGGRKPVNSRYAGQVHPSGVRFTYQGFPDFTPHARAQVQVEGLTGNRLIDNRLANQAAGFGNKNEQYNSNRNQIVFQHAFFKVPGGIP